MLASLLPGLRDVRTPLTVGYLWLFLGWLWFGDLLPRTRPEGDGLVAQVFDLVELLGAGTAIAAGSFLAYVLGSLITLPATWFVPWTGKPWRRRWWWVFRLRRFTLARLSKEAGVTNERYREYLAIPGERIAEAIDYEYVGGDPDREEAVLKDRDRARSVHPIDLRLRLLTANQELYGEFDRLVAEANFRLNICPPLAALIVTVGLLLDDRYLWLLSAIPILAYQALRRAAQGLSIVERAVLEGIVLHPTTELYSRLFRQAKPKQSGEGQAGA